MLLDQFNLHFEYYFFMKNHPYFSKTLPFIIKVPDAELPYGAEVMGKKAPVLRSHL